MAMNEIIKISQELTELKKDIQNPVKAKKYAELLIKFEREIESHEFEKIQRLERVNGELTQFIEQMINSIGISGIITLLRAAEKQLEKVQKDSREFLFKDPKNIFKIIFSKHEDELMIEVEKLQKNELKESKLSVEEKSQLEKGLNKKVYDNFKQLFESFSFDFETIFKLQHMLLRYFGELQKTSYFIDNKENEIKLKQIEIHMRSVDERAANEITHIIETIISIIQSLEYLRRHDLLARNLKQYFKPGKFNMQAVISGSLKKQYLPSHPLKIDYEHPWKTFAQEYSELPKNKRFNNNYSKGQLEEMGQVIERVSKLIAEEYLHKCDSPYHGIEHMSQVFITSVRIFKSLFETQNLGPNDFFVLSLSSIFHDTGYFVERFRHAAPGYMSSMHHVGHEHKSAQLAEHYLQYYKKQILNTAIVSDSMWNDFVSSIKNVISATIMFGSSFNQNKDAELQKIIRAADLLEMCSENYMDYLVPLYLENKIGNPKAPWPKDLNELLRGTPFFMNELKVTQERVEPIMKYLSKHPEYKENKERITSNLKKFFDLEKEAVLTIGTIRREVKKAA